MAKNVLEWTLVATDRASSEFERAGRSAGDMEKVIGRAGIAIGAALGTAAIAAGKFAADSIEAYAEAEQAQNRLNFAFEKFPNLAGANVKQIRDLNTHLQYVTRFEDDAIASSQGLLAQYGLNVEQLQELTPLMLDYAAATGKDVTTAAEDMGKAILGQGRALKAIGVDFEDAGDPVNNYNQLIAGLSNQVKGFAEKDAQTLSGRLDQLKNQFGDIQEKVGEVFAPGLNMAADIIDNKVLPKLDQMVDRLGPKIAEGIAEIGPQVEDAVDQALPLLERLGEALPGAISAATDSISGDIDFFTQTQEVFERTDGFFTEYLPRWAEGKVSVQESWDGFFNWWDYFWDGAADTVQNKSNEIKRYWQTSLYDMKTAVYEAEMDTAGWAFAQGFADGITSNSEAAVLAAEQMALRARDKVYNAMQIQSPSKVMRTAGAYVSEGFALGIEDGIPMVDSAAARMTSGIGVAASSYGASPAGMTVGSGGGGLTVVVNVEGSMLGTEAGLAQTITTSLVNAAKNGQINGSELTSALAS